MVWSLSLKRVGGGQLSTEAFTVIAIGRGKRVERNRKKSVARKVTKASVQVLPFSLFLFSSFPLLFFFFFHLEKLSTTITSTVLAPPLYTTCSILWIQFLHGASQIRSIESDDTWCIQWYTEPYQCSLNCTRLVVE